VAKLPAEFDEQKAEFRALMATVNKEDPDPVKVDELNTWLRKHPRWATEIFALSAIVQQGIIHRMATLSYMRTMIEMQCTELKNSWGYESAPVPERMLIAEVVTTWLHLQEVTETYHQAFDNGWDIAVGDHWERRLSAAQRRYLRATETLARIRKLTGRPVVQVNQASQMIVNN